MVTRWSSCPRFRAGVQIIRFGSAMMQVIERSMTDWRVAKVEPRIISASTAAEWPRTGPTTMAIQTSVRVVLVHSLTTWTHTVRAACHAISVSTSPTLDASMSWEFSNRGERLPSNWRQLRDLVRRRAGGRCEWNEQGQRCQEPGTDCDHITHGDDHSITNLQWLCAAHHLVKTQSEAARARARNRAKAKHPVEKHPGLM